MTFVLALFNYEDIHFGFHDIEVLRVVKFLNTINNKSSPFMFAEIGNTNIPVKYLIPGEIQCHSLTTSITRLPPKHWKHHNQHI